MSIFGLLNDNQTKTSEALAMFDSLEPVEVSSMIGQWKGEGFHTNHPLDGLLEAYRWHGKRFENPEEVHPLVFSTLTGNIASVNPAFIGPFIGLTSRVRILKSPIIGRTFQAMVPLFTTSKSRARLRMTEYRGKSSATMIYDQLPINDVFRKLDDDSVMGVMDLKGTKQPYFFILRRELGD